MINFPCGLQGRAVFTCLHPGVAVEGKKSAFEENGETRLKSFRRSTVTCRMIVYYHSLSELKKNNCKTVVE